MNNVEAAVKISERMAEPASRLGDIRKQMKFLERLREVKKRDLTYFDLGNLKFTSFFSTRK